MDVRPFLDEAKPPTAASLRAALGKAHAAHVALSALAKPFVSEWSFAGKSGWIEKVHDRKKALFFVIPLEGAFIVSLTVREKERQSLLDDRALSSLHEALGAAKKHSEGWALRFSIADARSASPVMRLLESVIALRARPSRAARGA